MKKFLKMIDQLQKQINTIAARWNTDFELFLELS